MENQLDITYESELYYNVVIRGKQYKGWRASYVSFGRMVFTDGTKNIETRSENSDEWMKECWEEFIKLTDQIK